MTPSSCPRDLQQQLPLDPQPSTAAPTARGTPRAGSQAGTKTAGGHRQQDVHHKRSQEGPGSSRAWMRQPCNSSVGTGRQAVDLGKDTGNSNRWVQRKGLVSAKESKSQWPSGLCLRSNTWLCPLPSTQYCGPGWLLIKYDPHPLF